MCEANCVYDGNEFSFHNENHSFTKARELCKKQGGDLATFPSGADAWNAVKKCCFVDKKVYRVGLLQCDTGGYRWVKTDKCGDVRPLLYTSKSKQGCSSAIVQMKHNMTSQYPPAGQISCESKVPYICEVPIPTTTTTTTNKAEEPTTTVIKTTTTSVPVFTTAQPQTTATDNPETSQPAVTSTKLIKIEGTTTHQQTTTAAAETTQVETAADKQTTVTGITTRMMPTTTQSTYSYPQQTNSTLMPHTETQTEIRPRNTTKLSTASTLTTNSDVGSGTEKDFISEHGGPFTTTADANEIGAKNLPVENGSSNSALIVISAIFGVVLLCIIAIILYIHRRKKQVMKGLPPGRQSTFKKFNLYEPSFRGNSLISKGGSLNQAFEKAINQRQSRRSCSGGSRSYSWSLTRFTSLKMPNDNTFTENLPSSTSSQSSDNKLRKLSNRRSESAAVEMNDFMSSRDTIYATIESSSPTPTIKADLHLQSTYQSCTSISQDVEQQQDTGL